MSLLQCVSNDTMAVYLMHLFCRCSQSTLERVIVKKCRNFYLMLYFWSFTLFTAYINLNVRYLSIWSNVTQAQLHTQIDSDTVISTYYYSVCLLIRYSSNYSNEDNDKDMAVHIL